MGRTCRQYCLNDGDGGRGLTSYGIGSETEITRCVGPRTCYNKAGLMLDTQMHQRGSLTYAGQAPARALWASGRLNGNPFLSIISSIHFRRRPVRSEGDRSSGLYTRSIIVLNSSDTSSTDIRNFANRIAINLLAIRTTDGPVDMTELTLLCHYHPSGRNVRKAVFPHLIHPIRCPSLIYA